MAEAKSEDAVRLRSKASEMLQSPSSIALASKEPKSSSFVTKSLAEMVNEDPIRLQNQSCVIHEEIVKIVTGERPVYSSLARLPTFSIGLSSTQGEAPPRAPPCESRVDTKEKSSHRYFQMPELGARVFVGDGGGSDTIACHLFDDSYRDFKLDVDSEYATIRSLYKKDRPGGLNGWLQAQHVERKAYSEVILSGTELFIGPPVRGHGATTVGNLIGKGSRVSGSSSDFKDCAGDETIRQPSDIVEQSGDPAPSVHSYRGVHWESVEEPDLWRSTKGSYLKKPKFMKWDDQDSEYNPSKGGVLQLTRFDDFVILGNIFFNDVLLPCKAIDIVRKNASESADVIATQLVKGVIEENQTSLLYPITAIVIFLDHKEILLRERKKSEENMVKFTEIIDTTLFLGLFILLGAWVVLGVLGILGAWRVLGVWGAWGTLGVWGVLGVWEVLGGSRRLRGWGSWRVWGIWGILVGSGGLRSWEDSWGVFGVLLVTSVLLVTLVLLGGSRRLGGLRSWEDSWGVFGVLLVRSVLLVTLVLLVILVRSVSLVSLVTLVLLATLVLLRGPRRLRGWRSWRIWGILVGLGGLRSWEDSWGVFGVSLVTLVLLGSLQTIVWIVISSRISFKNEQLGMKSTAISSNLTSAKVQDDYEASSSAVVIEDDDCKSKDLMVSRHITKWVIYKDLQERTLLCFFNVEEMLYEFYFEDHESMATIIGLGVPHSKVVLECGSPHVTVVEIPKEDWDVVWAHSNVIPCSIPEDYVLKQESFLDILHCIANVINSDNTISKANDGGVGGDNEKGRAQGNGNDGKGKGKVGHDHDNYGNSGHPNGGSNRPPDDNENKERKRKDGNDDKKDSRDGNDVKTSNDCKEVKAVVHLHLLPGGIVEDKGKKKERVEVHEEEREGKKKELGEIQEEGEKKEGEACKEVEKKKKKSIVTSWWHALRRGENQQERTTTHGVENDGDVENLLKELENQIHPWMVFTFTYRFEATRPLKTIQATIRPIIFQFPSSNEENYLKMRRFGWFHKKLQVAFGVVNTEVADLDPNSCKVLDISEAEEVKLQGNSKGNARTSTNAFKAKVGMKYGVNASGEYDRTNGSESKTIEEVQNSWKTNKTVTKVGFSILEHTDLNYQQLKYSYRPHFPFKEKEFEVIDEDDRLKMYENPICQLQRVSCEGTWQPYSENLEAYKLEASRELGMTRIYNLKLEIGEEKKKMEVWKVQKNQPLCFIQKLEKVVYLNHAMSHLTSPEIEVTLKEHRGDPFLTQAPNNREPIWPSNSPLVDVKQNMNI